jgi:hypothetical protein
MRDARWPRAFALLVLLCAAARSPAGEPREYVHAVEFPYYRCPRQLWEKELVALKNIGVRTVEFSIPWNWHQTPSGEIDFTGGTNPRRDVTGLVRLLRRLGMRAWLRPMPPVEDWPNGGIPADASAAARETWKTALERLLATQTASHGGPVAWVEQPAEGRALAIDAAAPPSPVTRISATDPAALSLSRAELANAEGSLLWTGVVDTLCPAGWEAEPGSVFRAGAAGFPGEEHTGGSALRRTAALLRNWAPLIPELQHVALPKPAAGKLPDGVSMVELASPAASAVSITNTTAQAFHDDVRVVEPSSKHVVTIPGVTVPPGDSLWLPVDVSLSPAALCRECSNFSKAEHVIFATAELLSIEYENGTLGLEFAAPEAAQAVLQLAREPVGPYLAAGLPKSFEWDDKTLRARLPIPASTAPGNRVHVVLAMELPQTSAFFNDARRLIVGQKNVVSTAYSSEAVATRSRLRMPEGYTAKPTVKAPDEIEYDVAVPADGVSGDTVPFGLEVDGVLLGRALLQLFPPVTVKLQEAIAAHAGQHQWMPDPPLAAIEPKGGTNLDLVVHNNWPAIRTFKLDAAGEGLDFFPPKTEIAVGAMAERHVSLRVFGAEGADTPSGMRPWTLRVTGAADLELPMRAILLPRGRTVAWSADLNGDGYAEWVLESARARAVFSAEDGGRWTEFTWKDGNANLLGDQGAFAAAGRAEVRVVGDALEFSGAGWKRTVRLSEATLTIEQTPALPPTGPSPAKQGNVSLTVERVSDQKVVYSLK